jgi:hypothetical protein
MGGQMKPLQKPIILRQGQYNQAELESLKRQPIFKTSDIYKSQLAELFEIDNPQLKTSADFESHQQAYVKDRLNGSPELDGDWVYFPWSGSLIHMVDAKSYFRLRTNRNQNLIDAAEQTKLANFTVGITGMSVGASIAVALAYSGISNTFKLADFDNLETANLNRLQSGVADVGQPKIDLAARRIYEINPYARILAWPNGLGAAGLNDFIKDSPKLDVVFDEIDDFEMKIRLRLAAQAAGVPVIMMTSLGDNTLVDVERYDTEPNIQIFNGLLGDLPEEILKADIGEREKIKYAMQIVGADYIPTRALQSLMDINRTLVGRPQLYSTIAVDGGLAAYLVKRLALGWGLPSGRSYISFDDALKLPQSPSADRQAILSRLKKLTG